MPIADCHLITLPRFDDSRGSLSFLEGGQHVPFDIKRIYYLYAVPKGQKRGGHAHRHCIRLLIPVAGHLRLTLDDGSTRKEFYLSEPNVGLYISPLVWLDIEEFSRDAVCLAVASELYNEDDYYRDYADFLKAVKGSI